MAYLPKRFKRPPIRSQYDRLKGCDCPSCSQMGLLSWLDRPTGICGTVIFIGCVIGLAAAYWWLYPGNNDLTAITAVKGSLP